MIAVCAYGAESGTRTHTPFMAEVFETSPSTNSAISAYKWVHIFTTLQQTACLPR